VGKRKISEAEVRGNTEKIGATGTEGLDRDSE